MYVHTGMQEKRPWDKKWNTVDHWNIHENKWGHVRLKNYPFRNKDRRLPGPKCQVFQIFQPIPIGTNPLIKTASARNQKLSVEIQRQTLKVTMERTRAKCRKSNLKLSRSQKQEGIRERWRIIITRYLTGLNPPLVQRRKVGESLARKLGLLKFADSTRSPLFQTSKSDGKLYSSTTRSFSYFDYLGNSDTCGSESVCVDIYCSSL